MALERDGNNAQLRRYSYGQRRIAMTTSSATSYYLHDGLGSVANLTSATGATQWTWSYEPYGAIRSETKASGSQPDNCVKFTGEYLDPTGLYHLRARQYDPTSGRFLTRDPAAAPIAEHGVSAYAYVMNRPSVFIDPSGLRWCWRACKATDFISDYYPRSGREFLEIYLIFETGAATAVAAGGTAFSAIVVCPAATAAGGPVGGVACAQLVATGTVLTIGGAAATVAEAQHYASGRRELTPGSNGK